MATSYSEQLAALRSGPYAGRGGARIWSWWW